MTEIIAVLQANPLLLLFLVAAIGFPLGRLKIGGAGLGVAAVLFVGLAFGALDPNLKLPEDIYQLGLVLFVYTIGLSSGSVFFDSLGRKGMRYNALVIGALLLAALMTVGAHFLFDIRPALTAGMFAGSLTNTPALASIVEHIQVAVPASVREQMLTEPVIAYSITYPIGVLGMILSVYLFQRLFKIDYEKEARRTPEFAGASDPLLSRTICIVNAPELTVRELVRTRHWNVVFGRYRSDGQIALVTGQTVFRVGDLVTLIGTHDALDAVAATLGEDCGQRLEFDLSQYDKRRIFVSSPQVIGKRLRDLDLVEQFGAIITRLRRGDVEILPHGNTVLAPGDQVRAVASHERMPQLARFLGDSYRVVSEVDILTFSLGLALGLLLGMLPIPLPGGVTLRLGIAGGPLVVSLILGALGRTGPFVWTLPYGANLTLRQIGLVFFLAGIGTRSGYAFVSTLLQGNGAIILLAGAAITMITALLTLSVGYHVLKIPMGLLVGILAGLQTQPALLGFGLEQSKDDLPNIGYASVYPAAMILKILLAQTLLLLLMR